MSKVGIIMGSDSDLPVMRDCASFLENMGIEYKIHIISAHRTPERMFDFAKSARLNGFSVIIAGAGGAAHLPGMVASMTSLPVIGVPVKSSNLSGLDSLLSIVQMPAGIPVATVAINGATNAGILAAKILGIFDEGVRLKIEQYMYSLSNSVYEKDDKLSELGYVKYLDGM